MSIRKALDSIALDKKVDRKALHNAEKDYSLLKKSADTLKSTNSSLYDVFKKDTSGIHERNFDGSLIQGFENLYNILRKYRWSENVWGSFSFLLKCNSKVHGYNKPGKQSPCQNQKALPNHSYGKDMSPGQRQPTYVPQHRQGQVQPPRTYSQSVVETPDSKGVDKLQKEILKLEDENKKLKEDAHIQRQLNEKLQGLEKENHNLKQTLKDKIEQTDEMTTRLSRYASQQLIQGNPNIADLSDANRPTKIGERFSAVYDDEWSDAYEILKSQKKSDEEIVSELAAIVKECLEFAKNTMRKQTDEITRQSLNVMMHPYPYGASNNINKSNDTGKGHAIIQERYAKDFIKLHASLSIPNLKKEFVLKRTYKAEKIRNYIEVLVELTWLMVVQDPPMVLQFINRGETISDKPFKAYQKSGKIASVCVWPALFLHENGPVVTKGFVLPST